MAAFENKSWKVDDIFQDIEGESDSITMNIPEEIVRYMGLTPGDTIIIKTTENGLVITKANN